MKRGLKRGQSKLGLKRGQSKFTLTPGRLGFPFSDCCQNHDECYGVCGSGKSSCDTDFLQCMQNACKGYTGVAKWACEKTAATYHSTVVKHGEDEYKTAQEDACIDCDEEGGREK